MVQTTAGGGEEAGVTVNGLLVGFLVFFLQNQPWKFVPKSPLEQMTLQLIQSSPPPPPKLGNSSEFPVCATQFLSPLQTLDDVAFGF